MGGRTPGQRKLRIHTGVMKKNQQDRHSSQAIELWDVPPVI
jgi:hypothetical protein